MTQQLFNRPPRIISAELPSGELTIPNPPTPSLATSRLNLLLVALPLVTILGYALVANRSLLYALPMGITAIISGSVGYLTWRTNQRKEKIKQDNYDHLLSDLQQKMVAAREQQQKFYLHNFPTPTTIFRMAQMTNSRLWERRPQDPDFGMARMGQGLKPSTVTFKAFTADNLEAPQLLKARKLADDFIYIQDAPLMLALRQIHAVGITGTTVDTTNDFVRALIVHLTAFHAPSDLRLYITGSASMRKRWQWTTYLPHCKTPTSDEREQLCFDPAETPLFWKKLQTELDRRQLRLDNDANADVSLPFLVVIVDASDVTSLDDPKSQKPLSTILAHGKTLGAAILFLAAAPQQIPGECLAVIQLAVIELEDNAQKTYFRYNEIGMNAPRSNGVADLVSKATLNQDLADIFARQLSSLRIRATYATQPPSRLTLLELYDGKAPQELPILENWKKSRDNSAHWPAARIGKINEDDIRTLSFEQNLGDGVHGLIAGTTGSGKSQLLMTLVTEIALNYDPTIVNFVLIDYKGGTTFEKLRDLPHTVDVITNLHGLAGVRAFTAIGTEIKRRERLLEQEKAEDIGEYHKRGLHLLKPFPHLLMIIDEFAELIKERPEFKGQLDSIARKGRALGVHLILATQSPGGLVSEQVQNNVKFRICLRVESGEDSRELLGRMDARYLPRDVPGRAYLRVGEDLSLMQIAQVNVEYYGPQVEIEAPVNWKNTSRIRRKKAAEKQAVSLNTAITERTTLLDVIVKHTKNLAEEFSQQQQKPWPDPLPDYLLLRDFSPHVAEWIDNPLAQWGGIDWQEQAMRSVIGQLDDPVNARQMPFILDFTHGHVVVFGISGYGKTGLLQTLITGLAATHSPEELQFYFLDFGRGLGLFGALPHSIALITADETERVHRLFRRLLTLMDDRKVLMGSMNLKEYNTRHPENRQRAVLLVLDNFADFRETFSELMESFATLAREGRAVGIHIVVSAEQVGAMPAKIYNLFNERLALRLAEVGEYLGVVGRGVTDLPETIGRGFIRIEKTPLEFQIALPIGSNKAAEPSGETEEEDDKTLAALVQRMAAAWPHEKPETVKILPTIISLETVITQSSLESTLLVISDVDLKPIPVSLTKRNPHFLVVGPPNCGKTTVLRSWLLSLAWHYGKEHIGFYLVDFWQTLFAHGGNHDLQELKQVRGTVANLSQLDHMIDALRSQIEVRKSAKTPQPELIVIIDNYDALLNELGTGVSRTDYLIKLGSLANEHRYGLHFIVAGSPGAMNTANDFMKPLTVPPYGLGLDNADSVSMVLRGRIRAGSAGELPQGRAHLVKSAITSLVQIVTPQLPNQDMENSLDYWVKQIKYKHA